MLSKTLLRVLIPGAIALSQYGVAHAQSARVYFIEPKDGATVTSPVHVKFGVDGMTVAPAGTMTDGTGHHHLIIDGAAVPKGTLLARHALVPRRRRDDARDHRHDVFGRRTGALAGRAVHHPVATRIDMGNADLHGAVSPAHQLRAQA
ncbi:ATPase of the AAA+ class [Candidatus Burkholderia verschuerenii]|uniref:ATPase of the AAA+ class n=1 Tax=Candidatus Burkholderia verschuerenii TaxID=242163 RepID=A0A0L0MHN6_9BURK|nr:DUF4399 domain-containing protein [Candidatus Burkholderia verschuerenii]KND61821.1 ATPase of the AAA+ class [Candidatus Burkholderia verschuerenii]